VKKERLWVLGGNMATVSEIAWYDTGEGKCPQCGRERPLGKVNDGSESYPRCIDCCFGPPMEYWEMCDYCGQLYVGVNCDNPKCEIGKNLKRL
jgi:hypothetical protein